MILLTGLIVGIDLLPLVAAVPNIGIHGCLSPSPGLSKIIMNEFSSFLRKWSLLTLVMF